MDVISINVGNAKVFLDGSEEFSDKLNVRQYINLDVLSDIAEVINSIGHKINRLVEYKILIDSTIEELVERAAFVDIKVSYLIENVNVDHMVEFEVVEDLFIGGNEYKVGTVFVLDKSIVEEYLADLKGEIVRLNETLNKVDFEQRFK